VDSTGIKFLGDGERQVRNHGVQGRRQWRKVHLARRYGRAGMTQSPTASDRTGRDDPRFDSLYG
jgi:hypothetical protein